MCCCWGSVEFTRTFETQLERLEEDASDLMEMTWTFSPPPEAEDEDEEGGPEMEAARARALPAGIPSATTESRSLEE